MRDIRFPSILTEHNVFFIQFSFFNVQDLGINTSNLGNIASDLANTVNKVLRYTDQAYQIDDTITLPLQSTIAEETTGNFDEAGLRNISNFASIIGGADVSSAGNVVADMARNSQALPEELRRGLQIAEQKAVNQGFQVFYAGPNRRNYTFEFTLIPRNIKDARTMVDIGKRFQYHASPQLANDDTTWTYPDLVSFKFLKTQYAPAQGDTSDSQDQGQPSLVSIDSLFESKKCYLESVQVTHGDDRYFQFSDGNESETGTMSITLTLKEVDYQRRSDFLTEDQT